MMFPPQASSEPGRRYLSMMEAHAAEFAPRAAELDRAGRFAAENVRALCASGALAAAVPVAFGGLGVESLYTAAERVMVQEHFGEIDVLLNAARATFAHSSRAIDDAQAQLRPRDLELAQMHQLNAAVDTAKVFIERSCVQVVDRCLTVSGGSGYLSKSALSRHYRDVRALAFMFPQATETVQYIGAVALDRDPKLDL